MNTSCTILIVLATSILHRNVKSCKLNVYVPLRGLEENNFILRSCKKLVTVSFLLYSIMYLMKFSNNNNNNNNSNNNNNIKGKKLSVAF